jgi:NADP-dependent alcohol dehydrogenase
MSAALPELDVESLSPMNFVFHNKTRCVFGAGQCKDVHKYIPEGVKKILMIYGGGSIKRNGVYDAVMGSLKDYDITEMGGIEPNPDFETCLRAADVLKGLGPLEESLVLAVGGGSVADAGKLIVSIPYYTASEDAWHILETCGAKIEKAVPLGVVLTLPATGSESNPNSVISYRAKKLKRFFGSPHTYPEFCILDPTTTYTLPEKQTKNGVVDAFVHVCEQYLTWCHGGALQDRQAEAILSTLLEYGPKVLATPEDYTTRANIMWCATQALNFLICQGVPQDWSTHMIGHELTAFLGLDHGVTLAIIQPRLLKHKFEAKKGKLAQMAERVFGVKEGSEEEKAEECIRRIEAFYAETMGVPTKISAYDCSQDKAWIEDAKASLGERDPIGEHGDILPADVEAIILASY